MTNHYLEVLGLRPGASPADIKKAYRRLAKKYHPDINKTEGTRQKFIAVHEAYKFLTEVGPTPNAESVNYDFNPQQEAYEAWRKRARAYAAQKAKEAADIQRSLIYAIYQKARLPVIALIIFNIFLAADDLLPPSDDYQQIVAVNRVVGAHRDTNRKIHLYDDVIFKGYRLRTGPNEAHGLSAGMVGQLKLTTIFNVLKEASFELPEEKLTIKPIYDIYTVFGYLIPAVLFFAIIYFYLLPSNPNKLTLLIVMAFALCIQLYIFIKFIY